MVQELHERPKRIMVVDDDECSRQIIVSFLEPMYDVVSVSSAIDALEYLEDQTVELFLIDIMMPVIDGKNFFMQLMKMERFRDVPKLFQTSLADFKTVNECIELGPAGYILKPIKKEELLHRIESALNHKSEDKSMLKGVRRVLYIDRNELNFYQMEMMLKDNFECTSVAGVIHALTMIEKLEPDVVLINMDNAGFYFQRVMNKIKAVNKKQSKKRKTAVVAITYKEERYMELEKEYAGIIPLKLPLSKDVLVETLLSDL